MANFEKAQEVYKQKGVQLSKDGREYVGLFGDIEFADENLDVLLADMDALVELADSDTFVLLEEVGDADESIIEFTANGEKHQVENSSVADALREAKELFTSMQPPPSRSTRRRRPPEATAPEAAAPEAQVEGAEAPKPRRGRKANGEQPAEAPAAVAEPVPTNAEFKSPIKGDTAALRYAVDHIINSLQALRSELAYAQQGAEEPAGEEQPKRGRGRPRSA